MTVNTQKSFNQLIHLSFSHFLEFVKNEMCILMDRITLEMFNWGQYYCSHQ